MARPLGTVAPKYTNDGDRYPEFLLVAMDDSRVIRYRIDSPRRQEPHFVEAMDILRRLPVFGGRKYRKTKNPSCDGSSDREGTMID